MHKVIMFIVLVLLIVSCDDSGTKSSSFDDSIISDGTKAMTDSIDAIIHRTNFRKHAYECSRKADLIAAEVEKAKANNNLSAELYIEYALALLNAGKSEESLKIFLEILALLPQNKEINEQTKMLHETIGLCYLRIGEQQNCIANHNSESCLFPIKDDGIHQNKYGSQSAIKKYEEILKVFPNDLRIKWLLNLAYMTIGEYPDGLSEDHLIPPESFKSEYDFPQFENISAKVGLDVEDLAGGVIIDDFNNDRLLDIIVSSWSMSGQIKIFLYDTNGVYTEVTQKSGLSGLVGGLNLIQADYNNDGFLDFYIIRGAWRGSEWMGQLPNSLIRNNGDGTFSDVTIEAGIYHAAPTQSAVWSDFDADGHIDLYVANETHSQEETHSSQLYRNNGDGTFSEIAKQLGVDVQSYVKGVIAGDVNNDGLPDLYISNISAPNRLFINKGPSEMSKMSFEDQTQKFDVSEPLESFPTWLFDFNNDGYEDLFVSSFDKFSLYQQSQEVAADFLGLKSNSDWPRLYLNNNGESFIDFTKQADLHRIIPTMGCNYGDLDNDGWLDFYLGTGAPDFRAIVPNRMFKNNNGKSFKDITFSGNFGHIQKGHGISFADLDRDGDQDVYAVVGGSVSGDQAHNALFENPGTSNNWVSIKLIGTSSNRAAIGAKIHLKVKTKDSQIRNIYKTVNSGGSFGANSLTQMIGIGDSFEIVNIAVQWPNGSYQFIDYGSGKVNSYIEIEEGSSNIHYLQLASVPFNKKKAHHHHH